jgi:hypothetical protein
MGGLGSWRASPGREWKYSVRMIPKTGTEAIIPVIADRQQIFLFLELTYRFLI